MMRGNTTRLFRVATAAVLALTVLLPALAAAQPQPQKKLPPTDRRVLEEYAVDTWESFVAMVDPATGLPADNINADTRERSAYTSPTNIGAYIWSTLAARDLGIIKPKEARARIAQTLETLAKMERHEPSGMYYNWYNPTTGAKLTTWPVNGDTVYPFLSSVDNGWLAAALIMVTNSVPQLRDQAQALADSMHFGSYYDPAAGLIRGGFWDAPSNQCNIASPLYNTMPPNTGPPSAPVYYTCHHYGAFNTEPRIASYIGIAQGEIPATHYFKMWRTFPDTCDWSWQEMRPEGETRVYNVDGTNVSVFEGHYTYRGMNIVPSWGGSMFEALMVPLLVPEEEWGTKSWAINHPLYVQAQIEHGLEEADYGYWGFSPSNNPDGGYREYGVDPIGLEPNGYASDQERTYVDYGFEPCRPGAPDPEEYGTGVVTPHASFLALDFAPEAALENLANLREDFDAYGWGGFYDAIEVPTGDVSRYYLALDQGMIMAAIANELRNDRLQRYFSVEIEQAVRPLMAMEEFTAGRE
ncbi:MAG TPA: glucoamylase family protein [Herpetosiphonaceae bacterium]|nr:glucoamylase family protein [Herpetosiphonaceae bacterium]